MTWMQGKRYVNDANDKYLVTGSNPGIREDVWRDM